MLRKKLSAQRSCLVAVMTDEKFDTILTIAMRMTLYTTIALAIFGAITIINTIGDLIWG